MDNLQKNQFFHSSARSQLCHMYRADESQILQSLMEKFPLNEEAREKIQEKATQLVRQVRGKSTPFLNFEEFLQTYHLSSEEGIVLMCLAEALLRIPDPLTADKLIRDKILTIEWDKHLPRESSWLLRTSTWGLSLTEKILKLRNSSSQEGLSHLLKHLVSRVGDPLIRQAIRQAMKILGRQFVMAHSIEEALTISQSKKGSHWRYSFDMLGEGARTKEDAERYYQSYQHALEAIIQKTDKNSSSSPCLENPGISVKLSALHPRYTFTQKETVIKELLPQIEALASLAKKAQINLTIDAEESDRLDLSLDLFEALLEIPSLKDWQGLGMAVQAYQKRALGVLEHLHDLSQKYKQHFMIRLVKGAYWDTEIKMAQDQGLKDYPVFTRKEGTDLSYLTCAHYLLNQAPFIFPQFATHNAYTVAAILEMSHWKSGGSPPSFEFQRLYGMGEALHTQLISDPWKVPCRVYAPIGTHQDLLAYLVRRLLENGANSSFVHKLNDPSLPIEEIVKDPFKTLQEKSGLHSMIQAENKVPSSSLRHPSIPLPRDLYGSERKNSWGIDLANPQDREEIYRDLETLKGSSWKAAPIINGVIQTGVAHPVYSPACSTREIGSVLFAEPHHVTLAFDTTEKAGTDWASPVERAEILEATADLLEKNYSPLIALSIAEAGKVIGDAIAEIREAIDFCRYYAARTREDFINPMELKGITGEQNLLWLRGRGTFVCISPWNFPLAIFIGQIAAALAAGNTVIAKPAEPTPLLGAFAVDCFYKAGVPKNVLQFLPGSSSVLGDALLKDPRVAGVVFTGSTSVAQRIHQILSQKEGPIVPFIAETGGINGMIIDSSSLMEQVIDDVVRSAFHSAGQRCSALRIAYVQEDVAESFIRMLKGAMAELKIGDPSLLSTDIGPVITQEAKETLDRHCQQMGDIGKLLYKPLLPSSLGKGYYIAPKLFELQSGTHLTQEAFGPILHMVRFKGEDLPKVVEEINQSGYGLTLGVHSRISTTIDYITRHAKVGNIYVNRNMIGAVVGVQPFGGEGLSGTGPKAGGPHYLRRFATERVITYNTTASGGNTTLLSLDD